MKNQTVPAYLTWMLQKGHLCLPVVFVLVFLVFGGLRRFFSPVGTGWAPILTETLVLTIITTAVAGAAVFVLRQVTPHVTALCETLTGEVSRRTNASKEVSRIISESIDKTAKLSQAQLDSVIATTEEASTNLVEKLQLIDQNVNELSQDVDNFITQTSATLDESKKVLVDNAALIESIEQRIKAREAASIEEQTRLESITEQMEQLLKLVTTISNISFQTNLLALNATIEAARAGTAGRGFAVVAGEVKRLSSTVDKSAAGIGNGMKEMSDLIKREFSSKRPQEEIEEENQSMSSVRNQLMTLEELMRSIQDQVSGAVHTLRERSTTVENMVMEAMGSIQFQDITRQKVEHVVHIFQTMSSTLEQIEGCYTSTGADVKQAQSIIFEADSVFDSYVMEDQRAVHDESVGKRHERESNLPAIELF